MYNMLSTIDPGERLRAVARAPLSQLISAGIQQTSLHDTDSMWTSATTFPALPYPWAPAKHYRDTIMRMPVKLTCVLP